MLATPPRREDHGQRDLRFAVGLVVVYVVPGLVLWVAAWLSGGRPRTDIWNWPATAIVALLKHQPLAPWTWAGAPQVASPVVFYALVVLLTLLLAAGALLAYNVVQGGVTAWSPTAFRRGPRPASIRRSQLRRFRVRGPQPRRMIIGQRGAALVATQPGDSVVIVGPSGAGKTVAVCVPVIQEWRGPVLAVGVGHDLVEPTAGIRQRRGMVDIFDPGAVSTLATCAWSPITGCEVMDVAVRRAGWMLPGPHLEIGPEGGDSVSEAVGAVLTVALWAGAQTGSTVAELIGWLRDSGFGSLRRAVERGRPVDPRAASCLASLERMSTPARMACFRSVEALFAGAEAHRPPLFDQRDFLGRAAAGEPTLYVMAPAGDSGRTASLRCGLVGAILDEAVALAGGGPGQDTTQPLLVVIDGTAGSAPVRDLAQYIAVAGQLDITFLVTFKAMEDVRQGYGAAADDVIGSAQEALFLGAQDEETLRLIGDLARRPAAALSGWRGGSWIPPRQDGDQHSLAESARLLGRGQGLLLSDAIPPLPFWTRPWTRRADLLELARSTPYAPGVGWMEVTGARPWSDAAG